MSDYSRNNTPSRTAMGSRTRRRKMSGQKRIITDPPRKLKTISKFGAVRLFANSNSIITEAMSELKTNGYITDSGATSECEQKRANFT